MLPDESLANTFVILERLMRLATDILFNLEISAHPEFHIVFPKENEFLDVRQYLHVVHYEQLFGLLQLHITLVIRSSGSSGRWFHQLLPLRHQREVGTVEGVTKSDKVKPQAQRNSTKTQPTTAALFESFQAIYSCCHQTASILFNYKRKSSHLIYILLTPLSIPLFTLQARRAA